MSNGVTDLTDRRVQTTRIAQLEQLEHDLSEIKAILRPVAERIKVAEHRGQIPNRQLDSRVIMVGLHISNALHALGEINEPPFEITESVTIDLEELVEDLHKLQAQLQTVAELMNGGEDA